MPKISPAEMRDSFLCPNERIVGAVRAFLSSADKHTQPLPSEPLRGICERL